MDCIFCNIVTGNIPAKKLFENEDVLAFLDINPLTNGHCLVIPKKHYESIFDIDKEILQKVTIAAQDISIKIKKSLRPVGVNLVSNNGKKAGQRVFHFHVHIIPRYQEEEMGKIVAMMDIAEIAKRVKF